MARTKQTCNSGRAKKRCRFMEYSSDDEKSNDTPFPSRATPSSYIRIFNVLSLDEAKEKNFVFSPCTIHLAMSLLANGSSGSTLKELLEFSEAETLDDLNSVATELVTALMASTKKGPKLSVVSGVWVDQSLSLNQNFKTVTESIYRGKADAVDFGNNGKEVSDEVNEWARAATNGLIDSLVSENSFGQETKLALANALYFKAKWQKEKKFLKNYTRDSTFYLLNGDSVEVPFMSSGKDRFIKVLKDSKVLRLPYRKSIGSKQKFSMHIILPNERDGLRLIEEKLSSDLSLLNKYLGNKKKEVKVENFKIPKFKIAFDVEASDILKRVGLELPFSNKAEFNELVQKLEFGNSLQVSGVQHKSYIEVNEEGTEAAASTVVHLAAGCSMIKPVRIDFVADHPFMFLIREEKSGVVLFMGHVVNPLLQ